MYIYLLQNVPDRPSVRTTMSYPPCFVVSLQSLKKKGAREMKCGIPKKSFVDQSFR